MAVGDREALPRSVYAAFNTRDVVGCLAAITPDVDWANGWEGGRVLGRAAARDRGIRAGWYGSSLA